jgi:hypothetical protein
VSNRAHTRTAVMITLLLTASLAHGGWWGSLKENEQFRDWCERYLVAADPYQFEQSSKEWLLGERNRLSFLKDSGRSTYSDRKILEIIEGELARRSYE